jgi:hypothetical protein
VKAIKKRQRLVEEVGTDLSMAQLAGAALWGRAGPEGQWEEEKERIRY